MLLSRTWKDLRALPFCTPFPSATCRPRYSKKQNFSYFSSLRSFLLLSFLSPFPFSFFSSSFLIPPLCPHASFFPILPLESLGLMLLSGSHYFVRHKTFPLTSAAGMLVIPHYRSSLIPGSWPEPCPHGLCTLGRREASKATLQCSWSLLGCNRRCHSGKYTMTFSVSPAWGLRVLGELS